MCYDRIMRWILLWIMACAIALTAACGGSGDPPDASAATDTVAAAHGNSVPRRGAATNAAPAQEFLASARVPGGDVHFGLLLRGNSGVPDVFLANGAERIRVRDITVDGSHYTMRLPAFNSTLSLQRNETGFVGTLTLVKRGGVEQVMPVRAVPIGTAPAAGPAPTVDFTGRWSAHFVDDNGDSSLAVGEFVQRDDSLTGTFLTPTGDYRYLAGRVEGSRFHLSCFDGGHAFLFTAAASDPDSISGHYWSGTAWHERWVAVRNAHAELPDPNSLTTLHKGTHRFPFSFPDVDGRIVRDGDDRFRGRVVVITLAGSWCPNCHDEAAFLARLYDRLHESGLEAVGLMYEHYRDFHRAARQVRFFARKYSIPYPLLVAGYSDKKAAAATLPALDRIHAFPTIIVVDKKGTVRQIHTGFAGPGTGSHYTQFTRSFTSFIDRLLAE